MKSFLQIILLTDPFYSVNIRTFHLFPYRWDASITVTAMTAIEFTQTCPGLMPSSSGAGSNPAGRIGLDTKFLMILQLVQTPTILQQAHFWYYRYS